MTKSPSRPPFAPEVRACAVRLVRAQQAEYATQWAAIQAIAPKIGCSTEAGRTLRAGQRGRGERPGLTTDERERLKALEQENRELERANETLRTASALFAAAELDRLTK